MIQVVRCLLGVAAFVIVARKERIVRQSVRAGLQPKEELLGVAIFERHLGMSQFLVVQLAILVLVKVLCQEVVFVGDSTISIQIVGVMREFLHTSGLL